MCAATINGRKYFSQFGESSLKNKLLSGGELTLHEYSNSLKIFQILEQLTSI